MSANKGHFTRVLSPSHYVDIPGTWMWQSSRQDTNTACKYDNFAAIAGSFRLPCTHLTVTDACVSLFWRYHVFQLCGSWNCDCMEISKVLPSLAV